MNNSNKKIPPLTLEQLAELEYLHRMKDEDIDLSDIPEITDEEFAKMKANRSRKKNLKIAG